MPTTQLLDFDPQPLQAVFGNRVQLGVALARYTAARVGGSADAVLMAATADELVEYCTWLWQAGIAFTILGGGSNVLVADAGVRAVVILNRARRVLFGVDSSGKRLTERAADSQDSFVWAESGANFGALARQAAQRGLAGLEWAAGIPGTLGGAVVGNAGAHGSDMAGNLVSAEILPSGRSDLTSRETWPAERFEFSYRSSLLKQAHNHPGAHTHPGQPSALVLAAVLRLERSTREAVQQRSDHLVAYRRQTQPPGASMGSMFKNPPGDFAGRLIEAAGLKGARQGNAQISSLHANFFVNHGQASAADIYALIQLAQNSVFEQFGVQLELEIEMLGAW